MNHGIQKTLKNSFFKLPSNEKQLSRKLEESQLFSSLWNRSTSYDSTNDEINAPTTLPIKIRTKGEVNSDVISEFPEKKGISLKFKQTMTYAKMIVGFYKSGVTNVWNSKKEVSKLMRKDFKLINQLNNSGKEVEIRIPSFKKLVSEMSQAIYMSQVETKTFNESNEGHLKRVDRQEREIDTGLFNLTRRQLQLINRTREDFPKLPAFAVIFMIFFECTPLLCYVIPEITPETCVLPSILPRMWSPKAGAMLRDRVNSLDFNIEDLALRTAFNLPVEEARLLARALRLTSKYIPQKLYPESILRRRLNQYRNYLRIDNYYLAGFNGEGNIWNLSNQELLRAALERNIIKDLKNDAKLYDEIKNETEQRSVETAYFNDLRLKLIQFIINFETNDIGYLCVFHTHANSEEASSLLPK
ncbi:uncharacterized protein PRCAT00004868001 [Priceomyces carsonii]|uniref:uncharacterized protein n=1 Tax=Priceomyces carsonii TaxID=28549 RepID=UPI002ED8B7C0|nr:unnamed protein product [Priceomyces carsonii]